MLNFQTLLVHIIRLISQCCLKKQIKVVYVFSFSNCLKKINLKCSDGSFFILLFQKKFYFSNRKLLGILYVISVNQMKSTLIIVLLVPFYIGFWTKFQNLMKGQCIETKITLKHIVLGYKIDDKNFLALNFFISVVGFSIYKSYYISEQNKKQSILMFIEYLSMNILKE